MSRIDKPTICRMVTAFGRSVQDGDADDLASLMAIETHLRSVIATTVAHMRTEQEITWATIGQAAGTTRQAAQQRWGSLAAS